MNDVDHDTLKKTIHARVFQAQVRPRRKRSGSRFSADFSRLSLIPTVKPAVALSTRSEEESEEEEPEFEGEGEEDDDIDNYNFTPSPRKQPKEKKPPALLSCIAHCIHESAEGDIFHSLLPSFFFFPRRIENMYQEYTLDVHHKRLIILYLLLMFLIFVCQDVFLLSSGHKTSLEHWRLFVIQLVVLSAASLLSLLSCVVLFLLKIDKPVFFKVPIALSVLTYVGVVFLSMSVNHWENSSVFFVLINSLFVIQNFSVVYSLALSIIVVVVLILMEAFTFRSNDEELSKYVFFSEFVQYILLIVFALVACHTYQALYRMGFLFKFSFEKSKKEVELELSRSEAILNNLLPQNIVDKLQSKIQYAADNMEDSMELNQNGEDDRDQYIFEEYSDVSTVFVKICDFEKIEWLLSATDLVHVLNTIFSYFDGLIMNYSTSLYRIKTISEKYMFCGGLPNRDKNHLSNAFHVCCQMLEAFRKRPKLSDWTSAKGKHETDSDFDDDAVLDEKEDDGEIKKNKKKKKNGGDEDKEDNISLDLRISLGLDVGSVLAGIIPNLNHPSFDVLSDSVNMAARMMQTCPIKGSIHISERAHKIMVEKYHTYLSFKGKKIVINKHTTNVKGKGTLTTYTYKPDFESTISMGKINVDDFDMNNALKLFSESVDTYGQASSNRGFNIFPMFKSVADVSVSGIPTYSQVMSSFKQNIEEHFHINEYIEDPPEHEEELFQEAMRYIKRKHIVGIEVQTDDTKQYFNFWTLGFKSFTLNSIFFKQKKEWFRFNSRKLFVFLTGFYFSLLILDLLQHFETGEFSIWQVFLYRYIIGIPIIALGTAWVFLKSYVRWFNLLTTTAFCSFLVANFISYFFLGNGCEIQAFTFIIFNYFIFCLSGIYFVIKVVLYVLVFAQFLFLYLYKFQLQFGISSVVGFFIFTVFCIYVAGICEYKRRKIFLLEVLNRIQQETLKESQKRTIDLLQLCLPLGVIEKLLSKDEIHTNQIIADQFESCSVLFCDLYQFTAWSSKITPLRLISVISEVFTHFDKLCEQYQLCRHKIIGDAFCCAGNTTLPLKQHPKYVANFALSMIDYVKNYKREKIQFRVGCTTGPSVGGVIGIQRFSYDLFGKTVQQAELFESTGIKDQIHCSKEFKGQYCHHHNPSMVPYTFKKRDDRKILVDGEETTSYWLMNKIQTKKESLFKRKKKEKKTVKQSLFKKKKRKKSPKKNSLLERLESGRGGRPRSISVKSLMKRRKEKLAQKKKHNKRNLFNFNSVSERSGDDNFDEFNNSNNQTV